MKTPALMLLCMLVFIGNVCSRDYVIYNIGLEIPMDDETKPLKNFYINMGSSQGLIEGTILDVYRIVSRVDPYKTKQRYTHKVKIGELKILHTEDETAIGSLNQLKDAKDGLYFEVNGIMIGDHVAVKIDG